MMRRMQGMVATGVAENREGYLVRKALIIAMTLLMVFVIAACGSPSTQAPGNGGGTQAPSDSPQQPAPGGSGTQEIRWATATVGSAGHRSLINLAALLNREWEGYNVNVLPMPGAVNTMKAYSAGEIEAFYASVPSFYEYAEDIGRFQGFSAEAGRELAQAFWSYTTEVGVLIHERNRDKFKSWRDLQGARIFSGIPVWDVKVYLDMLLETLGVEYEYIELDVNLAGSALEDGTVDAILSYSAGMRATAPWVAETQYVTDVAILNPSPEEQEIIKNAGFSLVSIDPSVLFETDVHVDEVIYSPFHYGLHPGLIIPEEDVYKMLTIVEEFTSELVAVDESYWQVDEDMVGMQVGGINATSEKVKIHPGLARYLKEKGAWDPAWDSRVAQ